MPEGIWLGQFNIVAGGVREDGPYAAAVPDRSVAESIADLYVALQPTRPDTDQVCTELMQTIVRVFGRSQYSVTGNLLLALGKAHQQLREWNRTSLPEHRLGVGITCVAIAGKDAYIAQAGPTAAFFRHETHIERLEPQETEALVPLGEASTLAPWFHRVELQRGDALLLLTERLAARLGTETIERCLSLTPDAGLPELYRASQRERDGGAVLLAIVEDLADRTDEDDEYQEGEEPRQRPGRLSRERPPERAPIDMPLDGERPRRRPASPFGRNPFHRASALHPDHGPGVVRVHGAEQPSRPAHRPKHMLSTPEEMLAALAAVSSPAVRLGRHRPSFRALGGAGGRRPAGGRVALGIAGIALVLLLWLGVPALLSSGRSQRYQSLMRAAQREFSTAQAENDLSRRRELLNQALSNADEAKRLKPSDAGARDEATSVQDALTVMDAVYQVPDVPTLADLSSAGLAPASAVEVEAGDRYYVLDVAAGKVYAVGADPNALPEVVYEDGSQIDGVRAGPAHHIAWEASAGPGETGTLLILDAGRHLFGLARGDLRAIPLRGVDQWRADTDLAFAGGNLYVLDAPAGMVWRYTPSDAGFDTDPAPAVASATIRDTTALSVVGGIFLTGRDSSIRRFLDGQEGPFKLAGIDKPPASPEPPLYDSAGGLLYIADRAASRVVVLEGDGRFKRQLVHQRLAGLRGLAVDSANNRLVGVVGQALVAVPLPR